MNIDSKLKEELLKGDFRNENEDDYVKKLKADNKKSTLLKIGMGTTYILLLLISLFIIN